MTRGWDRRRSETRSRWLFTVDCERLVFRDIRGGGGAHGEFHILYCCCCRRRRQRNNYTALAMHWRTHTHTTCTSCERVVRGRGWPRRALPSHNGRVGQRLPTIQRLVRRVPRSPYNLRDGHHRRWTGRKKKLLIKVRRQSKRQFNFFKFLSQLNRSATWYIYINSTSVPYRKSLLTETDT